MTVRSPVIGSTRVIAAGSVGEPCSQTSSEPSPDRAMPLAAAMSARTLRIAPGSLDRRAPSSWTRRIEFLGEATPW